VASLGCDGGQREGPTSATDGDDVESLAAAASILALFFGILLAITRSVVAVDGLGGFSYMYRRKLRRRRSRVVTVLPRGARCSVATRPSRPVGSSVSVGRHGAMAITAPKIRRWLTKRISRVENSRDVDAGNGRLLSSVAETRRTHDNT